MEELQLGTVISFNKKRGFGQVKPDNSEFGDKIFCYWKSIKTTAEWPTLIDGMRVAFSVEEDGKGGYKTAEVYAENGKEIVEGVQITLHEKGKKYKGSCKS